MNALVSKISLTSTRAPEFIDITDQVKALVAESGMRDGLVCVFSRHTTAAVKINEHEPLLLTDMEKFLARIAPADQYYAHNDFDIRTVNMNDDECPNGHSHCSHLLLGTSETIPLIGGALQLGRYQSVFLIELDHPREREVLVQILGA
ncbi:MAG: secondary thiamine-phosphate synthase enzyme YjbQ [Chloroflexota bacterium]